MKALKLLIAIVAISTFVACDKDEDTTTPVDQESLIGTWSLISLNADTETSGSFGGFPFDADLNTVGENFDYTVTFTETTYETRGSYDIVTTGTFAGVPLEEPERGTIDNIDEMGTYSLENAELTINGVLLDLDLELPEGIEYPEIDLFFNSNGELVMDQKFTQEINEEGIQVSVDFDSRSIWRKVE